ncbi:MAG: hypothetical protein R3B84_10725 [Zavarzinella sp.]
MIPVVDLDSIRVCWLQLEKEGFVLYGFLLYTNADTGIWSFIHNGGMLDLDHLTGDCCALFVLDRPPRDFVADAQQNDHVWYRYFSESYGVRPATAAEATTVAHRPVTQGAGFSSNSLHSLYGCVVVIGSENQVAAESLLGGPAIDRDEIAKVLVNFGLDYSAVPCITWFRSLDDTAFEVVDLKEITDQHSARNFLRRYFTSATFNQLFSVVRV